MTRRRRTARLAAALGAVAATGFAFLDAPSAAGVGCADISALAAADGVRTYGEAPGLLLTTADGQGPAAQAQVDALAGSNAWAGTPYSETGAGNAGRGNLDAGEVPTFAISSHPSRPEAKKTSPAFTLEAKSSAESSSANAVAGGPGSDGSSVGRSRAWASSACEEDGAIVSRADNVAEVVNFAGVFRIASVRSHAEAEVDPSGAPTRTATMVVEGASILGQAVAVTDRGVVVGGTSAPVPGNPLLEALADAGISVRYIAAVEDEEDNEVLAPGLEVTVARGVDGFGTGPATTVYTFGRAYARAAGRAEQEEQAPPPEPEVFSDPTPAPVVPEDVVQEPSVVGEQALPANEPAEVPPVDVPAVATRDDDVALRTAVPAARIADASAESIYPALVAGAVIFAAAWFTFDRLGVRPRWR